MRVALIPAFSLLLLAACKPMGPIDHLPTDRPLVTHWSNMRTVDAGDGELVHQMRGHEHGLDDLSLVMTETRPGGGPALHWHVSDETHIVQKGRVTYIIADSVFTVEGPVVVNVPARVPHTFINAGDSLLDLIAVFSRDDFGGYHPLGPNPLLHDP
ncbi:MAG: cupin domain-containing protein [Flavobacteriales bacterium]|nr:cupin domain-containing protein [Flavobacteriales bacterium]MCB9168413.1 cupin domain-containing protein [Flavobacteriales bacterium]